MMRIDVAAVRTERDETVRVFQTKMPRAGRSHRHPTQDDPATIDVVAAADVLDGLKHVRLSGPAVTVLYAAQWMQFDVRLIGSDGPLLVAFIEPGDKPQFAQADGARTTMQNNV